jgi:hypothetical protein
VIRKYDKQRWAPELFSRFRARERKAEKERGSGKKKEAPSTTEKMRKIVLFSSFAV